MGKKSSEKKERRSLAPVADKKKAPLKAALGVVGTLVIGAAIAYGLHISTTDQQDQSPLPPPPLPLSTKPTVPEAKALEPNSRVAAVAKLESRDNTLSESEKVTQMIRATAEHYCAELGCKKSVDELVATVRVIDGEEMVRFYQSGSNRPLTEAEKTEVKNNQAEVVIDNDKMALNLDVIKREAYRSFANVKVSQMFSDKDPFAFTLRYVLHHAWNHEEETKQANKIPLLPFSISDSNGAKMNMVFDEMIGWMFKGKDQNNKTVYASGIKEAVSDMAAIYLSKNLGGVVSLNDDYSWGMDTLIKINAKAGVSDLEMIQAGSGKIPVETIMNKWSKLLGAKDNTQAYNLLFDISLGMNRVISQEDLTKRVDEFLAGGKGVPNAPTPQSYKLEPFNPTSWTENAPLSGRKYPNRVMVLPLANVVDFKTGDANDPAKRLLLINTGSLTPAGEHQRLSALPLAS